MDSGNVTRAATSKEIADSLGLEACRDAHCTKEREFMRRDVVGYRKRRQDVEQNKDHVESMLLAGMDVNTVRSFGTANPSMVLTKSESWPTGEPIMPSARTPTTSGLKASSEPRAVEWQLPRATGINPRDHR